MQLMDDAILTRLEAKEITAETAYLEATQKQRFERFVKKKGA